MQATFGVIRKLRFTNPLYRVMSLPSLLLKISAFCSGTYISQSHAGTCSTCTLFTCASNKKILQHKHAIDNMVFIYYFWFLISDNQCLKNTVASATNITDLPLKSMVGCISNAISCQMALIGGEHNHSGW